MDVPSSKEKEKVSMSAHNGTYEALHDLIGKSEVVSFDIFDTLLIRPFSNPTDVFLVMERRLKLNGFFQERITAEKRARDINFAQKGSYEIKIEDIYKEIQLDGRKLSTEEIKKLIEEEIKLESQILKPSPHMMGIYNAAKNLGKKVIAISDMYLPRETILNILKKNNIHVDELFVSCEYKASKHEGNLYGIASNYMDVMPQNILHFGDNFKADYQSALQAGVIGYYVPSIYDSLYRDTNINQLAISQLHNASLRSNSNEKNLFASIVIGYLARCKADSKISSIAEQFGAMYAGPLVCGFMRWLDVMMRMDNVRHLRFATRDGYINKEIWDRLGFAGKGDIMLSSRRLTMLPALCNAFSSEIGSIINSSSGSSLRECIDRLALPIADRDELLSRLSEIIPLDRKIDNPFIVSSTIKALEDSKEIILKIANKERESYIAYLNSIDFNPDHDAIVDCGWALSSQRRTEGMLETEIRGYYVGTLQHAHMHEKIKSFLFHKGENKDWEHISNCGVELLELPFCSLEKSICRLELDGENINTIFTCGDENYERTRSPFISQMHMQINEFADFLKDFIPDITVEEMRDSLFILFSALVMNPTSYEYYELSVLPHNREAGSSNFDTIGTFWKIGPQHTEHRHSSKLTDYIRVGWQSLKYDGAKTTFARTRRVLRRKIGFKK